MMKIDEKENIFELRILNDDIFLPAYLFQTKCKYNYILPFVEQHLSFLAI